MIRFLFYPILGFVLGTTHPVVAVVSGSMDHQGDFDNWWESNKKFYEDLNISKTYFKEFSFNKGFSKGDILFVKRSRSLKIGDVIVFKGAEYPIIHRIVNIKEENNSLIYQAKGDANSGFVPATYFDLRLNRIVHLKNEYSIFLYDEQEILEENIIGKAIFKIPYVGYVKIWFVELFSILGFNKFLQFLGILR